MGDFVLSNDFDINVNRLLDGINIMDNKENRDLLEIQNKSIFINITEERNDLLISLKGELFVPKGDHRTRDTFKKGKAIALLLSFKKSICKIIKHMTILLDFKWKYSMFC